MAVGFKVGFYWYQIGSEDFLHSFFSTIAGNLENKQWGSKFPLIMNKLYQGKLEVEMIEPAINELIKIQQELKNFSSDKVIWDFSDLSLQPPWKDNISHEIINLSNYFVTSDGDDLIIVFMHALEQAKSNKMPIEIESI